MIGHKVYCHIDFQTFVVQKQARRKRENGEGRSKKRKHEVLSCGGLTFQDGCPPFTLDGRAHCSTKTKRVRTSFKQHQLLIMKAYFALNHNPDSKDLKQLSIKTGLSKRVLQVWFQNARAKYRRILTQGDLTEGHMFCELEQ
ncbi:LIM homeobox Lhx9-like isoform X2 [Paramuricea clavata]|nr:LIM homeobox Lhx9-like isoform X2 [Paramuricea clavata]